MTLHQKRKDWIFGLVGIAVGSIGAFAESWILQGDLDHSYPFKIMSVPPPEYYITVANTIASLAPFLAVTCGCAVLVLLRKYKIIAGIIPIITCPLSYIIGLWYLVSNGPYKNELHDLVNYDRTSAAMRHQEFYFGAISIMLFSVLVYLVFALMILGFSRLLKKNQAFLSEENSD